MMETIHTQEIVKVNAPIDQSIAGLVFELNRFPFLYTIESCQGDGEAQGAWICFDVGAKGSSWQLLSEFVLGVLGPGLASLVGDAAHVSINVMPSGRVQGEVTIRPGAVQAVTGAIQQLVNQNAYRG